DADCGEPLAGDSGQASGALLAATSETTHASDRSWEHNTSQDRAVEHQPLPCRARGECVDQTAASARRALMASHPSCGAACCTELWGRVVWPPPGADRAGRGRRIREGLGGVYAG